MHRKELEIFFKDLFPTSHDYCPNGLQVEGSEQINKIGFTVSATRDSIEKAVELQVDTLVVHHGIFWNHQGAKTLTGSFAKRVFPLVRNNINLFAYHLPLDAHPEIGNAAVLGRQIGCDQQTLFGNYKGGATGVKGVLSKPITAADLSRKLQNILLHNVILSSNDENKLISTVGIITGGASNDWLLAKEAGLDAFITGEISEHDWNDSKENDIHMFACGHTASETGGVKSLMREIQELGINCVFIDSHNPV